MVTAIQMPVRWSARETETIGFIEARASFLGDVEICEIDHSNDDLAVAAFHTGSGVVWLSLVKTRNGVQAFKNEQPEPYWAGRTLWDFFLEDIAFWSKDLVASGEMG